jgi:hypothetical protein
MNELKNFLADLALYLIPIVTPLVIAYLQGIKSNLAKIHGVQLSATEDQAINDSIEIGVRRAEEKANQLLGSVHALSGEAKQSIAIDSARRVGPRGLTKYDDDALKVLVDAAVQRLRPVLQPPPKKEDAPGAES